MKPNEKPKEPKTPEEFKDVVRRLLAVPKEEVDRQETAFKRKRARRK